MTAAQVVGFVDAFERGGAGMWVLLVTLLVMLVVGWGYAAYQVLSLVNWRRRIVSLTPIAEARNPSGMLEELGEGRHGRSFRIAAHVLVSAAEAAMDEEAPRDVLSRTRATLHRRLAGVHPLKGAITTAVLLACLLVPVLLGSFFEGVGLEHGFAALGRIAPHQRCDAAAAVFHTAGYPAVFGTIVTLLLAPPALLGAFLEMTLLSAKRRRDDLLRLVDMLVGVDVRPRANMVPGIVASVFLVVAAAIGIRFSAGPSTEVMLTPLMQRICVRLPEGPDLKLPVTGLEGGPVGGGPVVAVTRTAVTRAGTGRALVELDGGRPAPADVSGGVLASLASDLRAAKEATGELCTREPSNERCGAPAIVALHRQTPLETAALVVHTVDESWGRAVLLLRTRDLDTEPRTLADYARMYESSRDLFRLSPQGACHRRCPFTTIEVKEVVPELADGARSRAVLDGRSEETFGGFVSGLEQTGVVVARPSG